MAAALAATDRAAAGRATALDAALAGPLREPELVRSVREIDELIREKERT